MRVVNHFSRSRIIFAALAAIHAQGLTGTALHAAVLAVPVYKSRGKGRSGYPAKDALKVHATTHRMHGARECARRVHQAVRNATRSMS